MVGTLVFLWKGASLLCLDVQRLPACPRGFRVWAIQWLMTRVYLVRKRLIIIIERTLGKTGLGRPVNVHSIAPENGRHEYIRDRSETMFGRPPRHSCRLSDTGQETEARGRYGPGIPRSHNHLGGNSCPVKNWALTDARPASFVRV
jgi:hypothetical protein